MDAMLEQLFKTMVLPVIKKLPTEELRDVIAVMNAELQQELDKREAVEAETVEVTDGRTPTI